ncbi:E3 ubiquitin-protein ligase UPL5-like [Papaver somniferum]|uniref:E3 ubiquitin-protein ligase UPL5-like n=1 Tax=Papaver somniferum TaxID=3469 RepID=UPI000E6FE96F|nr:E3 ubiquitin-protein ligase UPL5-like [Papaver somniferum]
MAKECIRLFLVDPKTNSGFFLPRSMQHQCATIVLSFCEAFYRATDDEERQLYYSCRETLISILKPVALSDRPTCFGITRASQLIGGLYRILHETEMKLLRSLVATYQSPSPLSNSELRSLKRSFSEFALFSHHIRSATADHVRVKGRSLPLNPMDFKKRRNYLDEIYMFHNVLLRLVRNIKKCLHCLGIAISEAEVYEGGKELLAAAFQDYALAMSHLIWWYSKRGDDHLWLLKYDTAIDFESRRHLMEIMFPEEGKHDSEKVHKVLIDRSMLLTQSYERIAHVKAKSLHNGLSVKFKDEVATGPGVLREWLFLVSQALFSPEYSLFTECPEDRRRFFPTPAKVTSQQLKFDHLCGRVIALALMHKVELGIAFDRVFFLQLAEENISLEDIKCADPTMYKSCKKILEMDADLVDSDVMGLTFVREIEVSGSRKTVELCPGGMNIVANSNNRE